MRKIAPFLMCLALGCGAARAQNAYVDCPAILPHDAYLHQGGKLALLKLPDVPQKVCASVGFYDDALPTKTRFENRCDGAVQFHLVVRPDGSVRGAGVARIERAGIAPVLRDRALAIRFAPPLLGKEPVCVRLDAWWDSASPGKLHLPDDLR
jgi:hypothetical protein